MPYLLEYKILTENSNHLLSIVEYDEIPSEFPFQIHHQIDLEDTPVTFNFSRDPAGVDNSTVSINSRTGEIADRIINRLCLTLSKQQNYAYNYYPQLIRTSRINEGTDIITSEISYTTDVAFVARNSIENVILEFPNSPSIPIESSYLFKSALRNGQNGEFSDAFLLHYIALEKLFRTHTARAASIILGNDVTDLYDLMTVARKQIGLEINLTGFEKGGIFREIRNDIVHGLGQYSLEIIKEQLSVLINRTISIFNEFNSE